MYNLLSEIGDYSTGVEPPWFVPIIGFFILFVIFVRIFGSWGLLAWIIGVFCYYTGILGIS